MKFMFAFIPQLNKRPTMNYIHTSSETTFCLYIWVCSSGMCVCISVWGIPSWVCMHVHAVPSGWCLLLPYSLISETGSLTEPELTNRLDLLAREPMGCHYHFPVQDYRQGLHPAFYIDAGDGNLGLYACTASILSTPFPKPLTCS